MKDLTQFETTGISGWMKLMPHWINWRAVPKANGKVDKIPINPITLKPAKTNDYETWTKFKTAVESARRNDLGIGFVFTDRDPFVGIDLDDCFEEGKPAPWAQKIVNGIKSYSEITPSGKGLHIIARAKIPGKRRRKGNIETYEAGRFFTVTGRSLVRGIRDAQPEMDQFYLEHFGEIEAKPEPVSRPNTSPQTDQILNGLKSSTNFHNLFNGDMGSYPSQSEADLALCSIIAKRSNDPQVIDCIFRQSGLYREKWDQLRGAETYGQITISKAIESTPTITITSDRNLDVEIEPERFPVFPANVICGLAGEFAQAQAECIEAPEAFLFFSFLTALGSVLSGRVTIKDSFGIQPRLYTLILGESAEARKSTSIKVVSDFFTNALDKNAGLRTSWGFGSAEGLQKRLADDSKLLLCLDEFKSFVSKATIKSSVLLPAVTQLFESNSYENQTKTSAIKIDDGHLSLLAASTIDTYERTWDTSFSDIGFLNRLFLIVGNSERKFAFPKKLAHEDEVEFKARSRKMVAGVYGVDRGLLQLSFSREGFELHNEWYLTRELNEYARRLDTYALRLMLLLAINSDKTLIDAGVVRQAIELCNWQLEVRKILSPVDGDNPAAIMEEKIRRMLASRGDLTKRELRQFTNADRSGFWLFDTALNNLIRAEDIVEAKLGKTLVYHNCSRQKDNS